MSQEMIAAVVISGVIVIAVAASVFLGKKWKLRSTLRRKDVPDQSWWSSNYMDQMKVGGTWNSVRTTYMVDPEQMDPEMLDEVIDQLKGHRAKRASQKKKRTKPTLH